MSAAGHGGFAAVGRHRPAATARGPLAAARGPLASALAVASSWLLEPAEPTREAPVSAPASARPVVAVFGLARGCGTTVVARALAAELASRDASGAAAVHCEARAVGIPLATHAAGRLARVLADVPGADTRAVGRLCLVGGADGATLAATARHVAPLVLDAGATSLGGVPAAVADQVVVVARPAIAPALAAVAADCLARLGHEPVVVLNRAVGQAEGPTDPDAVDPDPVDPDPVDPDPDEAAGWGGRAEHLLPDSRMGAQLALGGREPRGELGRAIARLADRCEGRR